MTRVEATKWLKTFKGRTGMAELSQAFDIAIKALEQEPCTDVISRQAVLDKWENTTLRGRTEFDQVIMMLPPVTPQQKTGRWIYDKTIENWQCSECNETPRTMGYVGTADFMAEHFRFCNHCGTKMEVVRE